MPLPDIKISLPVIFVAWAVGSYAAGLWPLLIYPAMWLAVGAALFGVHAATGGMGGDATTSGPPAGADG